MRIALFHNLLSGGAKRTLLEATRRLSARHHVDAYALSCSEHEFADIRPWVAHHFVSDFEPSRALRSPFGRANQLLRCADLLRLRRVTRDIARQIEAARYDVVFAHPCRFEQSSSVLRYLRRIPSVYYCQEPLRLLYETMPARPYDDHAIGRRRLLNRIDPLPGLYRRMLRTVDQTNTRSAGTILVNSRFMAANVGRIYGVVPQVSYLGVDVDEFAPVPTDKRHMVLAVGSLTPLKAFDFLIRSMAEYSPVGSRPQLVIASNFQNPDERAYLTALARELGVEMSLPGTVTDKDLVQLYNEARVVLYAPVREPFGLVPLEAMACATPVVAVAEGGVSETIVDGETGFLVQRDTRQFAGAVRKLIDDPALARRFGESGRAHVLSHWTWDRAVASLERHLEATAQAQPRVQPRIPVLVQ
jgi:glycosyltransferase involved in cell wall biosynthesis